MLSPGLILNNTYRIERFLGQGGMASVYEVSHTRMSRRFALKIITVACENSEEFRELFHQEAEILSTLRHPHLVEITDFNWTEHGQPYLVMELLQGESLLHFLERARPLAPEVALQIVLQICDALKAIHARGIYHLDLTPSNIFLCEDQPHPNFAKVLDFGIARITSAPEQSALQRPRLLGTPGYMAPEQLVGEEADAQSDQFALATILHEMLTGVPLFGGAGKTTSRIFEAVCRSEPAPLADPELNALVQRALCKSKEDRFSSISSFARELASTRAGQEAATRGQARWTAQGRATRTSEPHAASEGDATSAVLAASPSDAAPAAPQNVMPLVAVGALLLLGGGALSAWLLSDPPRLPQVPDLAAIDLATIPARPDLAPIVTSLDLASTVPVGTVEVPQVPPPDMRTPAVVRRTVPHIQPPHTNGTARKVAIDVSAADPTIVLDKEMKAAIEQCARASLLPVAPLIVHLTRSGSRLYIKNADLRLSNTVQMELRSCLEPLCARMAVPKSLAIMLSVK